MRFNEKHENNKCKLIAESQVCFISRKKDSEKPEGWSSIQKSNS